MSGDCLTAEQLHRFCDRAEGRFGKTMEMLHNSVCLGSGILSVAHTSLEKENLAVTTVRAEAQKEQGSGDSCEGETSKQEKTG